MLPGPEGSGVLPAAELLAELRRHGLHVSFAESCTAGMASAAFASVPGASEAMEGSIVTYSNRVKREFLKVPAGILERCTAVSRETAEAMAEGVARLFGADLGLSVTGYAGPGGGTPEVPVGTVWLGASFRGDVTSRRLLLSGSREEIRQAAVLHLLAMGLQSLRV